MSQSLNATHKIPTPKFHFLVEEELCAWLRIVLNDRWAANLKLRVESELSEFVRKAFVKVSALKERP